MEHRTHTMRLCFGVADQSTSEADSRTFSYVLNDDIGNRGRRANVHW